MKISFMTLGCPDWDLDTICKRGQEYGFDGVDFRGLQENLDITTIKEFTTDLPATARRIADHGLAVSAISSSIRLCNPSEESLDEARRTIAVCGGLDCRIVRVFGGGNLEGSSHKEQAALGSDFFRQILELDGADGITWVVETHDNWIRSSDCVLLINEIDAPNIGILWDMGHTARVGNESPEDTFRIVGDKVRYTHVKDAVFEPEHPNAMKDGWRYVLPGEGQLPLAESVALLKKHGYDGWIQMEHEKRWHRDLPEPEVIFPHFQKWVTSLI